MCRTYGAPESRAGVYPALTGWANLCRAAGAGWWIRSNGAILPRWGAAVLRHYIGEEKPKMPG